MSLNEERLDIISEAYERLGSWRAVARELNLPRSTVRHYQRKLRAAPLPVADGHIHPIQAVQRPIPKGKSVRRYIVTCAQNNTFRHEALWENLKALAFHYDAEILVSRFAYNTGAFGQAANEKPGAKRSGPRGVDDYWYDSELRPHFCDERVQLAKNLVFCGESNISPTATRPLSGMEGYTGRDSAIFPHTKIAMTSVPSGKYEGVKLLYTTGCVTQRNYIQRKAGLKAEFHHTYGAVLVEVNSKGHWFVRQLNADSQTGEIQDLDVLVSEGQVRTGQRVEAITFGDVHAVQIDPTVAKLGWEMLSSLRPREVHLHDLLDFRARNHHDRGNPHLNFEKHVNGTDDVGAEVAETARLLKRFLHSDEEMRVYVVQSNHDDALTRWLREADYRTDPKNALFFLECQTQVYQAIAAKYKNFHLLEWVMGQQGVSDKRLYFLRMDESHILVRSRNGGIECGMHGHAGPNGSRGNPLAFSRMGRKANIGHSHTAGIIDGVYVAGTSSNLDLGYNVGPSSWTHTHIITYPSGKRSLVTMYAGAWRA